MAEMWRPSFQTTDPPVDSALHLRLRTSVQELVEVGPARIAPPWGSTGTAFRPPKMRRSIVINHLRHTKKCQTELDAWNLDEFGNFTMKSWYSFQDWFDESCNITAGKPEVHPGNNIPNPKQFASGDDTSNPSNPWQGFCWQKHDQFRAEMGYKSQIFLVYVTAVKVMGIWSTYSKDWLTDHFWQA